MSTAGSYPLARATDVAARFEIEQPLEAEDFVEKGNINQDTFVIRSGPSNAKQKHYLLQRINQDVFTRPWTVMAAMVASLDSQRRSLEQGRLPAGREWDVITLAHTHDGQSHIKLCENGRTTYWRLMERIRGGCTFKSLSEVNGRARQLELAEEAARGLATYGDFTSDMDASKLESPLPGYRDTSIYYNQLKSVLNENHTLEHAAPFLPRDNVIRQSTEQHFLLQLPLSECQQRRAAPDVQRAIEDLLRNEEFAMTLLNALEEGRIRRVAIHGDTKLDNFLFSIETGKVKALVDLDTIMPHTWLVDWGDMVRSLVNIAGEKEADLDRVQVDLEVYGALAHGFLSSAREVTDYEVGLMAEAVEILALELGLRFLTDYLRGDSYFGVGPKDPPELNKIRALAQLKLFERLQQNRDHIRRLIETSSS